MKKSLIFVALAMVLCFCTSSYGADAAGHSWYLGIGGSWAIENFDTDDLEDELLDLIDVDFDDGYGFQAKLGYHLCDNFSLGLVFDYITGFDSEESVAFSELLGGVPGEFDADIEVDVWTLMVEGKASMSGTLSPYAVLGVGILQADGDLKLSISGLGMGIPDDSAKGSGDDTIACGKVGLGVDWWASPDVTVGLEGNYVFVFGDHDFGDFEDVTDNIEVGMDYFTIALGIAYHF